MYTYSAFSVFNVLYDTYYIHVINRMCRQIMYIFVYEDNIVYTYIFFYLRRMIVYPRIFLKNYLNSRKRRDNEEKIL